MKVKDNRTNEEKEQEEELRKHLKDKLQFILKRVKTYTPDQLNEICYRYIFECTQKNTFPTRQGLYNILGWDVQRVKYLRKRYSGLYKIFKYYDNMIYSLWISQLAKDSSGTIKYLNVVHKFTENNEYKNEQIIKHYVTFEDDSAFTQKLEDEHFAKIKAQKQENENT